MTRDANTSLVLALGEFLRTQKRRLAVAESCTGGLVASQITDISGSSDWFEGALVAYDNRIKTRLLGVPKEVLTTAGAVSGPCVEQMAKGVSRLLNVPVALAVSGIAGPAGGSVDKPVGTVWIAWMVEEKIWSRKFLFSGDRLDIKAQSATAALAGMLAEIKNGAP